jgi:hypothetical protein
MSEATTEPQKEEGSQKKIAVFEVSGIFFFTLSLAASVVIILRPLGALNGAFSRETEIWLLFTLGFAFGIVLTSLGATTRSRRNLSIRGGANYLALGFVCAVEIFLLGLYEPGVATGITSLWWLSVIYTVLGTLGVYLPVRGRRRQAEREKRKQKEARRKAIAKERRSPRIIIKVRRYYFTEKKLVDWKN